MPQFINKIFNIAPYIMASLLSVVLTVYTGKHHPETLNGLLIKIDGFGISEVGAHESRRIKQINALPLPFEKRQVLIQRSVFIGASKDMVYLALGLPNQAIDRHKSSSSESPKDKWYYYFDGDKRPTVLAFENGVLESAYKGSGLDLADLDSTFSAVQRF